MSDRLNILSLGAGVQSSTLALMAAHGELEVDHAIFADTQGEPQIVYDWLEWLTPKLPFPVHIVSAGNLIEDFLASLDDPSVRSGQPPFMSFNHEKQKGGRLWRQCTSEYKLVPIRRKLRELCGGKPVNQLIGISLDEAHRMKPARVKYITNLYPLIDRGMSRHDCFVWMKKNGYPEPPKSACYYCPYMSNERIREMKDKSPVEYDKLVKLDQEIRRRQRTTVNGARITGDIYIHRDCKPIDEIDLRNASDFGQGDLFGEECEGMCGV